MTRTSDRADAGDSEALSPGEKVGEYVIDGLLGEGGFGAVYRATHALIGKTAAIKVIKQELSGDAEMVSRFVSEARAVNAIGHRNIIDIFGFGRLRDGRHYYVMELLDGRTLEERIQREGPLPITEALEILRPLARALDAAHGHVIAHRDLKPENIFLANVGEPKPLVKLLDFGIAKLTGDLGGQHTTQAGMPMGTPSYMSPEQVNGAAVDARTDVYSFGIVAFEMLSANLPFLGESALDVMVKQAGVLPPPLSTMRPELGALDEALLHMMEKQPDARPATILAAADELVDAAVSAGLVRASQFPRLAVVPPVAGAVAAAAEPPLPLPLPRRSPPRWLVPAVALALALGVVGVSVLRSASPTAAVGTGVVNEHPSPPASAEVAPPPQSAAPHIAPVSADVHITVKLEPTDAEVYIGTRKISTSPFVIARGSEPVTVEVRKQGYVTEKVPLIPDRDRELDVTLRKQGQRSKEYGTWD